MRKVRLYNLRNLRERIKTLLVRDIKPIFWPQVIRRNAYFEKFEDEQIVRINNVGRSNCEHCNGERE